MLSDACQKTVKLQATHRSLSALPLTLCPCCSMEWNLLKPWAAYKMAWHVDCGGTLPAILLHSEGWIQELWKKVTLEEKYSERKTIWIWQRCHNDPTRAKGEWKDDPAAYWERERDRWRRLIQAELPRGCRQCLKMPKSIILPNLFIHFSV